jgi:calcineurin-like phosphoesterase family protein
MSEKCKSILSILIQVKNWQKTVSTKDELDIISQLEKGTQIAEVHRNVRFANTNILIICDNADRITESAKSETIKC